MLRASFRLAVALALFTLAPPARHALACDCVRAEPASAPAFDAAAFVALGHVGEVRDRAFELIVDRLEKGPTRARVEVRNEGGSCGFLVRKGERLLVYAGEAEGHLFVRQCASTRVVRGEAARREADARAWERR